MKYRGPISFLIGLFMSLCSVSAMPLDSIEVSLITCSPGQEVYALYGHSALRCRNFSRQLDIVFNYGVFSFEQPHFIWRFIRGKCDYMVQAVPWEYFVEEYEKRGSSVTGQILDLRPEEANRLMENLLINCLPENREYRYNFLTNNCTSMVLDKIEESIDGQVDYGTEYTPETYRQILHRYTASHPWAQEGNDFLLGASMDTLLDQRATFFAPEYAMRALDQASVYGNDGSLRPLVKETVTLVPLRPQASEEAFPLSPTAMAWLVIALFLAVALIEQKSGHMWWWFDIVVLTLHGLAGLLILFMFFFSSHPGVDSNWQLLVLNPYPLIALPWVVKAAWKDVPSIWQGVNFFILTFFILFSPWMPQVLGNLVVPLTFALLTRPLSYYWHFKKKRKEQKNRGKKRTKR